MPKHNRATAMYSPPIAKLFYLITIILAILIPLTLSSLLSENNNGDEHYDYSNLDGDILNGDLDFEMQGKIVSSNL